MKLNNPLLVLGLVALVLPLRAQTPFVPENAELIQDIPYAGNDNPRQSLDLLLPKKRHDRIHPPPLIVFVHGGGWQNGGKESGIRRIAPFVASGDYVGTSINYRLSNEAKWPAQIHDCKAAIRWLRGNAEKYNIDPDKVAVWGISAGGHLVAMLGVSHGVEELEGDIGAFDDQDTAVTAVVDFYGPSELLTMDEHPGNIVHNAPDSPESRLLGNPIQENKEKAKNASPVTHVTNDDASHLIVHGDQDPLVPYSQSVKLDQLLDKAGVESIFVEIVGGGHGRGFDTPELHRRVAQFLDKHLRGIDVEISEEPIPAATRPR